MPLLDRQAHLQRVLTKRGAEARRELEDTIFKFWVDGQVIQLQAMDEDGRQWHLGKLEKATNARFRAAVERKFNEGNS
ncbi:MAG TPA: hypothetical protein VF681_11420 [Abditibacteriaceae bacterium]